MNLDKNENEFSYEGSELELFKNALNWKRYFSRKIKPFIEGDVLEVGAGIGANTNFIKNSEKIKSWTCLEPDYTLLDSLRNLIARENSIKLIHGTIDDVKNKKFNTIIYIDVLEHIEDDCEEISKATKLLRTDGRIIILSPAYQILFSPFDNAIGHFRRYSKSSIKMVQNKYLDVDKLYFLDSLGVILSIINKLFLKQKEPTIKQISFWDTLIIPISKFLDLLVSYSFGRSIIAIFKKNKYEF